MGRLVRWADPDPGERRDHAAQWPGGGPGRAARLARQSTRSRLAVDRCSQKDRTMKVTTSNLIRFAGLALVPAGIVFAGIQPIHPADVVESVTTTAWAIITSLKFAMCLLFLVGITGLYARQVDRAGWLGLAGFLLLVVSWWLLTAFVFAEAFILPLLAASEPAFTDALLGI